jgi:hypothetical protein
LTLLLLSQAVVHAQERAPVGFTNLLVDSQLTGWHGRAGDIEPAKLAEATAEQRAAWTEEARTHFRLVDGVLENDGFGPFLTTDREFGDFELLIEYAIDPTTDSGIYLRGMPQIQIWDPENPAQRENGNDMGSGGLWNNAANDPGKNPLVRADKPAGEWNAFRIKMIGERVWVWLNDQPLVVNARLANYWDRSAPLPPRGPIQLQTHGGRIRWRNIFVREIGSEEANSTLAEIARESAIPLFTGSNLDAWQGAMADYTIEDGALMCLPERGGNLFTKESFGDFQVSLEISIPPGGNNGLLIRYPGSGNGAYDGMCELQVIDTSIDRHGELDPRQFHGSAYGMVPAARGYLRPPGEWNFQVVTVRGSEIQVELNGTRILDADLSKVDSFMADSAHPGKDLREGFFGFAGHNDPVRFRNVYIRRWDP